MRTTPGWLYTKFFTASVLASMIFPLNARCADITVKPAGELVISRDVPQHSAFRAGDRGVPTVIATAREDLVLAGVGLLTNKPIALSDFALSGISSDESGSGILPTVVVNKFLAGNIGSSFSSVSTLAGDSMRANESVTGATSNIGSALSKNIAPIGSVIMSAFPVGK